VYKSAVSSAGVTNTTQIKKNNIFENSTGRLDVEAVSRYFEKIQICWVQNTGWCHRKKTKKFTSFSAKIHETVECVR
jgi:hypothetical protein